ncbi:MAG: NYN domain-containing protein [Deltaproteobacteria bacterium]|jgi:uncharacterized LabA/DUF88 family protein|nr:NYN domain-containing protein [Deltaproteobacteria bacterium]
MSEKQRILVFVDEANVTRAASRIFNRSFDWMRFRDFLVNYGGSPRELVEMVVYVGIPPDTKRKEARLRYAHFLKSRGFLVYTKEGHLKTYNMPATQHRDEWYGQKEDPLRLNAREVDRYYRNLPDYKANVDVIMAIDAVDLTMKIRPDIVILVTGDSDFAHLALTIRREGIKVEVASAPQTLSAELRVSADRVLDLSELFDTFERYEPKGQNDQFPQESISEDGYDRD